MKVLLALSKRNMMLEFDDAKRQGRAKPTSIPLKSQGRTLLLGELDGLVQQYILAASKRGNAISRNITVSAVKVIMERYPRLIGSVDIESSHWAQSLFRRMGFRRRQATTSKLEIPEGALKEIKVLFHHDIITKVTKFNIPDSLIISLDQTSTKHVPVGHTTLAKRNSKTVTSKGSTDKQTITATFAISLRGDFLPMQPIYGGQTKKCLSRFKFPEKFSLSYNETHYSNEKEACKFIEEILKPYIKQVIERDNQPIDQRALVIMDVFKGQVTPMVLDLYKESNIVVVLVPANMTNHLQPLDLTVNGYVKRFMRAKFNSWYSSQLRRQLDEGKQLQDIDVPLRLSILKPFHAEWLVDCYNHTTTTAGRNIILSGWKSAGIMEILQAGTDGLESLDPFNDIDPLIEQEGERNLIFSATANQIAVLKSKYQPEIPDNSGGDESEWENEDDVDFTRNAFDNFNDEPDL